MLFVFGDSYVDTGNSNKSTSSSWMVPYGITFPGTPDGRYSDGLILTDFLADSLGLKSPLPYVMRKNAPELVRSGINFAFGGTGVLNTFVLAPNMTTQIDFLQNLVDESAYTKSDLQSSLSLVSVAGNDYSTYLAEGGSFEGLPGFITRVAEQIAVNLKRIHDIGVGKVAVGALQPLGCLPEFTAQNNFQQCNETVNTLAELHNTLLQQAVAKLNNESKDSGAFVILDIYGSFTSVLNHKDATVKFENLLKPCCMPMKAGYFCGSVDAKGEKMYTQLMIFFDSSQNPLSSSQTPSSISLSPNDNKSLISPPSSTTPSPKSFELLHHQQHHGPKPTLPSPLSPPPEVKRFGIVDEYGSTTDDFEVRDFDLGVEGVEG
ncbi:hypothetical protein Vadar_033529 [Vaccinium darrowii]|uniref:Uncharacterized protein n=1 Tax=Vaccinium darrowii TaxID=229202 RepID=A0ACB7YSN4_9ERIC|nr:hypothetical protein Vadar_033529 [Vaccinium darrowii]